MGETPISLWALTLCPPTQLFQLQVVATNSALTELGDSVKAGAIESQDTPTNAQKRIKGVSTLVRVNFRMWT